MQQKRFKVSFRSLIQQIVFVFLLVMNVYPQQQNSGIAFHPLRSLEPSRQMLLWEKLLMYGDEWYLTAEAQQVADNILIYQRNSGGWPKNIDFFCSINDAEKKELIEYSNEPFATIDNGASYTQLYFLARMIRATYDQRYVLSFLKGFDYLIKAQYPNGGWPQFYPLRKGYYSHITYNDDAMIGVMSLLRDVAENSPEFAFLDTDRRQQAQKAVEKGIECILKTQVKVNDTLTAWCAQYDEKTLKPAKARSYELPSLSGKESVGIILFLMGVENPSSQVIDAIQSAVAWLDKVRIDGIRVVKQPNSKSPRGFDKIVISDSKAPPLWARFYRIGSNEPFFSDRDGKIYDNLSEISAERRNEYGWLGDWPWELLTNYYPLWQQKWAPVQMF
jgi:PelA/Pel-15E family pectate lyase